MPRYQKKNFNGTSCKGTILEYTVSDSPIIKNHYVGQKDCFLHTLKIEKQDGEVESFGLCQVTEEKRFDEGTFVSFKHVVKAEVKGMNTIISKSLAKTYTPEEIAALNAQLQKETVETSAPTEQKRRRSSLRK